MHVVGIWNYLGKYRTRGKKISPLPAIQFINAYNNKKGCKNTKQQIWENTVGEKELNFFYSLKYYLILLILQQFTVYAS